MQQTTLYKVYYYFASCNRFYVFQAYIYIDILYKMEINNSL